MVTPELLCANWNPDGAGCMKAGRHSCSNCRLVVVGTFLNRQERFLTEFYYSTAAQSARSHIGLFIRQIASRL